MVALALLVLLFENWRGKHAWESYRAAMEAQGEHFDMADFIPPPVPDEKNFAMTRLLKPLLDYSRDPETLETHFKEADAPVNAINTSIKDAKRAAPLPRAWLAGQVWDLKGWQDYYRATLPELKLSGSPEEDVMAALGRFDAMLEELRDEGKVRPLSRFPMKYEEGTEAELPHIHVLQNLEKVVALRAVAELKLNRTEAAFADVEFGLRMMDAVRDEPRLVSQLTRLTMSAILIQPVWEGISRHQWTDAQLARLEEEWGGLDFLADYWLALRSERADRAGFWSKIHHEPEWVSREMSRGEEKHGPWMARFTTAVLSGVIYQNQLYEARFFQEILPVLDEKSRRVDFGQFAKMQEQWEKASKSWSPYTYIAKSEMPIYGNLPMKFAQGQMCADEAAVGCEIERYRLAHGALPATLEDLHMAVLPHDIINGGPLHYRVSGDNYVLYSVGWNQTDDGGKVVLKPNSNVLDFAQGDWVWSLKPL